MILPFIRAESEKSFVRRLTAEPGRMSRAIRWSGPRDDGDAGRCGTDGVAEERAKEDTNTSAGQRKERKDNDNPNLAGQRTAARKISVEQRFYTHSSRPFSKANGLKEGPNRPDDPVKRPPCCCVHRAAFTCKARRRRKRSRVRIAASRADTDGMRHKTAFEFEYQGLVEDTVNL